MGCAFRYDDWEIVDKDIATFNPVLFNIAMGWRGYDYNNLETLHMDTGISEQNLKAIRDGLKQPTDIELGQISQATGMLPSFFYRETRQPENPSIRFVCGEGIQPCHVCGAAADFLCDYPIGNGKTCDLPLCNEHRQHIGIYDYCPAHPQYPVRATKKRKKIQKIDNFA